jgi:hypothetical protein
VDLSLAFPPSKSMLDLAVVLAVAVWMVVVDGGRHMMMTMMNVSLNLMTLDSNGKIFFL